MLFFATDQYFTSLNMLFYFRNRRLMVHCHGQQRIIWRSLPSKFRIIHQVCRITCIGSVQISYLFLNLHI